MKPVHPQSEELTKVRTVDDALDEFDQDDQTMIGNSEELAAKSMMVPDMPEVPRASTNVIRRTGPTMSVRPLSDLPTITAEGTKDEPVDDDDAFAPWDDAAQRTAPQAPEQLVAALNDAAMTPSGPIVAPAMPVVPAPPVLPAPVLSPAQLVVPPLVPPLVPMPPMLQPVVQAPTEPAPVKGYRWDRIAFVMVIVAMLGICIAGYLRIASLEDELARTKAALDAKSR